MSGKRCKALRSEFGKSYGRAPLGAKLGRTDKSHGVIVTIVKSEWRLLKQSYLADKSDTSTDATWTRALMGNRPVSARRNPNGRNPGKVKRG